MFEGNKTVICIYLSRKGCLAYTQAMVALLKESKLVLVVTEDNTDLFKSNHSLYTLNTAKKKAEHLLRSLTIQKKIDSLIKELQKTYGEIELYFPAFHPWNLNFIRTAKRNKIPSTVTIHDYKTHRGEQSSLVENMQNKMIHKSDRVVFLTEFVRQQAIKELGSQNKFEVQPHPALETQARQSLSHSRKPSILFLGRGVAYKGLDLLLDAIKELPISKLTIAGKQNKPISAANESIELIDRYLSQSEIDALLANHHILILPYTEASQSGVLTLGLSAGIPMVITKVGGLPEQLPTEAAIWVEPKVSSLKSGIEKLINEPETYKSIKLALNKILETSSKSSSS